jgi:hypothetical protein
LTLIKFSGKQRKAVKHKQLIISLGLAENWNVAKLESVLETIVSSQEGVGSLGELQEIRTN